MKNRLGFTFPEGKNMLRYRKRSSFLELDCGRTEIACAAEEGIYDYKSHIEGFLPGSKHYTRRGGLLRCDLYL